MIEKAKHAVVWSLTTMVATVIGVVLFLKLGPYVEEKANPLFTDVTATFITLKQEHVDVLVTGTKARNCLLKSAKADVLVEGRHIDGIINMLDRDGEPLTVEEQRTSKGDKFVRVARYTPSGTNVTVTVYSQCHPFWLSQQKLFELDITKYPAQVR